MGRTYTLEEQIEGLREVTTSSPHQFAVKTSILETLGRLQSLRNHIQSGKLVDDESFAKCLATALGEPPKLRRS
jgi:hypothetical protein